ncbi:MAG: hypothetical protein Q8M92_10670 [Candidatus Subteraquimicrobiales bacterium]|nr:hypothetical protein [Candidatus Subteraquimicrobiales bacterium]
MGYDFNGAKTTIKTMLTLITINDTPLFQTVLTGNPGVLTLYMGNTAIFGLGDSKKANRPIGDRGSILSEGLLIVLTPGESEEAYETLETMISAVLSEIEEDRTLGVPGLRVEHGLNNLIQRRSINITPKAKEPTLCAGAIIPLDVTVTNKKER